MLSLLLPLFKFTCIGLAAFALAAVLIVFHILVIKPLRSPLRNLPGPKSPSIVYGLSKQIIASEGAVPHEAWEKEYGHVVGYQSLFMTHRLSTTDMKALSWILAHPYEYPKPYELRNELAEMLGLGLLSVEGDVHKRQRTIMNPSFGLPQIRELTPVFFDKAILLCDILLRNIAASPPKEGFVTNILHWTSRTTLDIIGIAGFDYAFNSLEDKDETELAAAASKLFGLKDEVNFLKVLKIFIPFFRIIPDRSKLALDRESGRATLEKIGMQLIREKKEAVLQSSDSNGAVEKGHVVGKDLLTSLIRANMSVDLKESQRMTDKEVIAQISTFLIAGHETTSMAVAWCLYALCKHPDALSKVRSEVLGVNKDIVSMEELNALPYLGAVTREVLRLYAPVRSTNRMANNDGFIPVGKPFVDRNGKTQNSIKIKKGDRIFMNLRLLATSTNLWGEDAKEFKPERWEKPLPPTVNGIPSVFSNIPTFLAGPKACIGYRFAVTELKAIVFTFLRKIDFELADPTLRIGERTAIVTRPYLVAEPEKGNQLPLRLKAL